MASTAVTVVPPPSPAAARGRSMPWALAGAALLALLIALDLARPYAGPSLRPAQWAAAGSAVLLLAAWLRARGGTLGAHWTTPALAALLVPTYVDHTRRLEIGDPTHYYSYLRSLLFDGDLDLANDFVVLGWAGQERGAVQPVGPALLWSPLVIAVHLGRQAARLFGLAPPDGSEPVYAAAVALSTFAYGCAGLFVLLSALRRFASPAAAFWTTVLLWVGSPLRFYLSVVPAAAHGIEFFAAALVLWTWLRLRDAAPGTTARRAAEAGAAAGLVFLTRSQDGLLLLLPATELALRLGRRADRLPALRGLTALAAGFAAVALPQVLVWQAMFGRPFLVPHERLHGSAFLDLAHPRLSEALVDARGGLFSTHPVLLFALLGLVLLARRHPRYVLGVAPVLLGAWYVNASVFDWYHVRRYTGVVPLLAPGLALLVAPLARTTVLVALAALLVWRYDLAVDGLRPQPGHPVPVRAALLRVGDDLAARAYRLLAPVAPGAAVRILGAYTGEMLLADGMTRVDLGGDPALLRVPEAARHLSAPTFEDGEAARWVTDRTARLALPLDAPGGVVLRLRARPLETPEPQAMEASWNGRPLGRMAMAPGWSEYRFDVPPEAMRGGTNVLELWFERAPIYHRVRGRGPRQVRPAALSALVLNRR